MHSVRLPAADTMAAAMVLRRASIFRQQLWFPPFVFVTRREEGGAARSAKMRADSIRYS
eukprot:COSAG01_NODE_8006_length_2956_cov_14.158558_2_plen_59_part_00